MERTITQVPTLPKLARKNEWLLTHAFPVAKML